MSDSRAEGMEKPSSSGLSRLRDAVFPIYGGEETGKFLALGGIQFFIIFVLTLTRDLKDTLIVTSCGAEAISFLKVRRFAHGVFRVSFCTTTPVCNVLILVHATTAPDVQKYCHPMCVIMIEYEWVQGRRGEILHSNTSSNIQRVRNSFREEFLACCCGRGFTMKTSNDQQTSSQSELQSTVVRGVAASWLSLSVCAIFQ